MRKTLFLVLLVGCGGGGGGGTPDSAVPDAEQADAPGPIVDAAPPSPDAISTPSNVSDLFDALFHTVCNKAFDCRDSFPGSADQFTSSFGNTIDECIPLIGADSPAADYQASVDAGRIVFNPEDGETCIDTFGSQTCDQFWGGTGPNDPACDTTFVGQVADGDACTMTDDCANDASDCTGDVCTAP